MKLEADILDTKAVRQPGATGSTVVGSTSALNEMNWKLSGAAAVAALLIKTSERLTLRASTRISPLRYRLTMIVLLDTNGEATLAGINGYNSHIV
jgi:hypothetical protein